jgi:hypothetical protein
MTIEPENFRYCLVPASIFADVCVHAYVNVCACVILSKSNHSFCIMEHRHRRKVIDLGYAYGIHGRREWFHKCKEKEILRKLRQNGRDNAL